TYDGASRQIVVTDPLGNSMAATYDNNGNAVQMTRTDVFTVTGTGAPNETFTSAMFYDCLNQPTVMAMQGPDGTLVPARAMAGPTTWTTLGDAAPVWSTDNGTLFSFTGYDSRSNRT